MYLFFKTSRTNFMKTCCLFVLFMEILTEKIPKIAENIHVMNIRTIASKWNYIMEYIKYLSTQSVDTYVDLKTYST